MRRQAWGRWAGLTVLAAVVYAALLMPQPDPVRPDGNDANVAVPKLTGEIQLFDLHENPRRVPNVEFRNARGQPLTLEDFLGRVVLLNLWATWCAPCRYEMPALDRVQKLRGGRSFEVVAVSSDRAGLAAVRPFFDEVGVDRLKPYLDPLGRVARGFQATTFPTTILIDARGREIGRLAGPAEWDAPEAVALIDYALSRTP